MTLWEARMGSGPNDALLKYTSSIEFDRRLADDDIRASIAHVNQLNRAKILSDDETSILVAALKKVKEEISGCTLVYLDTDEDVHTAIERRVTEICGEVGGKLHTGRSRNDQVSTALRLFVKRELSSIGKDALNFAYTLLERAESEVDVEVYLPGYTHLQRAQPVMLAHHLLAHGWALIRDIDRIVSCLKRADVCPLGAGALAGSSLNLDPDGVAVELEFKERFKNSLDAVSDRDYVAESLFVLSMIGIHLSRMGEEVVLWSSQEFNFMVLDDAFSTGSSMLPQKKNPDIAELARGKAGRLIGNLTGFLATLKGLPLSYNRDLQEDKEPLFDAIDQIKRGLIAMTGLYSTATFNHGAMRQAADSASSAAVDIAEWLVERGKPFREAHAIVGSLVRDSIERRVPLPELVATHPELGNEVLELLEPGVAVTRRTTPGGAGPIPVRSQVVEFRQALSSMKALINDLYSSDTRG